MHDLTCRIQSPDTHKAEYLFWRGTNTVDVLGSVPSAYCHEHLFEYEMLCELAHVTDNRPRCVWVVQPIGE